MDGIFPPSPHNAGDSAGGKQQQQHFLSNHNKNHSASIQNNYDYNVVEVLQELSLIDDLASSDEDNDAQEDLASTSSKANSEKDSAPYIDVLNKRQREQKSKQKKSQKLSQIIFGGLSQPIRSLSCHPLITCDLVSNGQRLCPPQQTQYKQMSKRYEYVNFKN